MQACSIAGEMARASSMAGADKAAAPADEANLLGGGAQPQPQYRECVPCIVARPFIPALVRRAAAFPAPAVPMQWLKPG